MHRDRNAISALVGIVGFFSVWGLTTALAADGNMLAVFVDIPSAVLVVLTPATILFAVYGWAGVVDAFAWIFRRPTPGKPAREAAVFFQLAAAFALAGGFLATMVGMVLMLANMDDVSMIGSGMALTLLSQLYGVFLAVLFIALAAYVTRRHNDSVDGTPVARRAAGVAGITTIAGTLTVLVVFGIMMLSLAPNL
jgi:flagellar motor component MotA